MNVFEYFYSSTNIKQDEGGGSSKPQIIFLAQVFLLSNKRNKGKGGK